MHDHWIGLVASAFGSIEIMDSPLMKYRQHAKNWDGAKGWGWKRHWRELRLGKAIRKKKLSNLICPNDPLPVTTIQCGIGFIERDEPFGVSSVGAFYEELLKVIWFFR